MTLSIAKGQNWSLRLIKQINYGWPFGKLIRRHKRFLQCEHTAIAVPGMKLGERQVEKMIEASILGVFLVF
ncbi:MAG: hypothetical protein ACREC9_12420 [Methylocella sp.]